MRPARLLPAALAVALAAAPATARAQFIFGQSFTAPGAPNTFLQSLTVGGLSGQGGGGGNYVANIFVLSGTTLVGPSLFSQNLGPSFDGFTLAPNRALLPGATYAVTVAAIPGQGFSVSLLGNTYADGTALTCFSGPSSCQPASGTGDLDGFTVTFGVAPAVVPEPATWALVGAGLLAVGGVARRRRA